MSSFKKPISEYKQPEGWYSYTPDEPIAFTNGAWYERSKILREIEGNKVIREAILNEEGKIKTIHKMP